MEFSGALRRLAGAGTAVATALLITTAPGAVAAATTEHKAEPCGYYTAGLNAYYNNCGTTSVRIKIDRKPPKPDEDRCLSPGNHNLGPAQDIIRLVFVGTGC
ncbi:DUF6355 family natural product biosynthesis protein [Kibdelosporangium phytohabitans]|nr:DUF6355 family natural product biosynthesis protein [Kibdelosporangium phytohabitans]MBE1467469.1 hypothetical protein [Kibdelosporangium phytohabitans]